MAQIDYQQGPHIIEAPVCSNRGSICLGMEIGPVRSLGEILCHSSLMIRVQSLSP